MLLEPSPDQEFLRDTTAKFLSNEATVADLRALRHDPDGFDRTYWRRGAELGWTTLLVDEAHGGGSISGRGLVDLTLIAHEFGRHGAPGPLAVSNVVASALASAGAGDHDAAVGAILAGTAVATWAVEEGPGPDRPGGVEILTDGPEVVISGVKRPVEAAAQADWILVTGRTGDGYTQALVPAGTPGLSVQPLRSADLTRRFATVTFDSVRLPAGAVVGEVGRAGPHLDHQLVMALVLLAAESVGAMERGFEMTVEWAFDRYSFGRPLASYQALKHRFADMKSWLEGSHAITDAAAEALTDGRPDAVELAHTAKAYTGQVGGELLQDCVQLHGGIGVTFDHDLHIFLRRATVNRMLLGAPADHYCRLGRALIRGDRP